MPKQGPDIKTICGGEVDCFSRKARKWFSGRAAGVKRFYKRKFQRRSRATAKLELKVKE